MCDRIVIAKIEGPDAAARIALLAHEIWTEHYVSMIGQTQVDYMLERFQSASAILEQIDQGYEYYLVRTDGNEAGYFSMVMDSDNFSVQLSKIYVKRDRRRSGVGEAIIRFVQARCDTLGARDLWLTVNRHNAGSIAFYARMGFVKEAELVTDIGNGFVMDDYKMVRRAGVREDA